MAVLLPLVVERHDLLARRRSGRSAGSPRAPARRWRASRAWGSSCGVVTAAGLLYSTVMSRGCTETLQYRGDSRTVTVERPPARLTSTSSRRRRHDGAHDPLLRRLGLSRRRAARAVAYYNAEHRARLELIRALQDHGFTLRRSRSTSPGAGGRERRGPRPAAGDADSWTGKRESMTRRQLETRPAEACATTRSSCSAGSDAIGSTATATSRCRTCEVALELLELDIPADSMEEAAEAINRHMDALADELTDILRRQVLDALPRRPALAEDAERLVNLARPAARPGRAVASRTARSSAPAPTIVVAST